MAQNAKVIELPISAAMRDATSARRETGRDMTRS